MYGSVSASWWRTVQSSMTRANSSMSARPRVLPSRLSHAASATQSAPPKLATCARRSACSGLPLPPPLLLPLLPPLLPPLPPLPLLLRSSASSSAASYSSSTRPMTPLPACNAAGAETRAGAPSPMRPAGSCTKCFAIVLVMLGATAARMPSSTEAPRPTSACTCRKAFEIRCAPSDTGLPSR